MEQLAIIKTGGKQYLVSPGKKIKIEKIKDIKKEKKEIVFEEVLLAANDKKIEIGTPFVKGAKVIGEILKEGKNKKVIVFKYKAKTRHRTKKGHRQPFFEVEIKKIEIK